MKSTDQTPPAPNPEPEPAVRVRVAAAGEQAWFDQRMADGHYLGAGRPVGDCLRQIVEVHGRGLRRHQGHPFF